MRLQSEYSEQDSRVNSISFHRTHDLLVSASNDDIIRVYDSYRGQELNTLQSKKYGVANICYTHDPQSVVYSSTKVCTGVVFCWICVRELPKIYICREVMLGGIMICMLIDI